jgi:DNA ligase (NAD+)
VFHLSREEIIEVKGFSDKTADGMLAGLRLVEDLFSSLYQLNFNLIRTPIVNDNMEEDSGKPLLGKLLVFTGAMQSGNREEMKKQAKTYGAKIGNSITGKTDMLICGERVGAAKRAKAEKLGVQIIPEKEYLLLLQSD